MYTIIEQKARQDVDKQMMMVNIINAGTRQGYNADSLLAFVNWKQPTTLG